MRVLRIISTTTLLIGLAIFPYLNQLHYHYLVPPGGDPLNHLQIVLAIESGQHQLIFHYHSLWYLLTILVSHLTHLTPITTMAWLGPGLLSASTVTLYFFNRRFFGQTAGIVSAIIFALMTLQPLQTLQDGGFPNVLAAGVVLPLSLMAVENIFSSYRKILPVGLAVLGLVLLLLSHHITALYGGLVITLFLFIQLVKQLEKLPLGWVLTLIVPAALFVLLAGLVSWFLASSFNSTAQGLAKGFLSVNSTFPFIHIIGQLDNPNAIIGLSNYSSYIGEAPVYLGLAGLLTVLGWLVIGRESAGKRAALILVIWATLLAVSSQQEGLGFPIRLARDLAVPLCLLAGLFIQQLAGLIAWRRLPVILTYIIVSLSLSWGYLTFFTRLDQAKAANPLVYHLKVDSEAADNINRLIPAGSKILVFQDDIYLGLFTPKVTIIMPSGGPQVDQLANPVAVKQIVPAAQYVYIERRLDRVKTATNHDGIAKSYLASPLMSLVFKYEQPEKKVYLFKIKPSLVKSARLTAR